MPDQQSELLATEDVVAFFNGRISAGALYVQRTRGEKPGALAVRIGKRLYWRRTDLEAYFEEERVAQGVAS